MPVITFLSSASYTAGRAQRYLWGRLSSNASSYECRCFERIFDSVARLDMPLILFIFHDCFLFFHNRRNHLQRIRKVDDIKDAGAARARLDMIFAFPSTASPLRKPPRPRAYGHNTISFDGFANYGTQYTFMPAPLPIKRSGRLAL